MCGFNIQLLKLKTSLRIHLYKYRLNKKIYQHFFCILLVCNVCVHVERRDEEGCIEREVTTSVQLALCMRALPVFVTAAWRE